ncbi:MULTISPECIES: RidA family protein [Chryseobacterium]|uniref:RidA family protein n=1 Tax=Chryseobacterium TaxID=59732 RepID=UPI001EF906B6|nr:MULTISPECIES: RidA family protein [Chryseobacterium]MBM7420472.1 enamine deaminase RidA (YjgF/YER057c/UK114 family) [Chryseobacterium sp. JUb44]MDH6210422.1 enamine deaminase RidA (YjgF/YER057c/UK114 family) [Chryseobacterium sp. BIGb0186]WSO09121.1 RidA family protein [Chryseobacterium scophthalmum]
MINFKYYSDQRKHFLISTLFILLFAGCSKTEITPIHYQKDMSNIQYKNPKGIFDPTPFAFSHSTSASGKGNYVFISGQSGGEGLEHKLSKDFRTQVTTALQNLSIVLEASDLTTDNVLKITILIIDHDEEKLKIWTEEMHKVWKNNQFPASTLIPVPKLALDGMLIEVDAVAFIPL